MLRYDLTSAKFEAQSSLCGDKHLNIISANKSESVPASELSFH